LSDRAELQPNNVSELSILHLRHLI
jgi:hypothetical protein